MLCGRCMMTGAEHSCLLQFQKEGGRSRSFKWHCYSQGDTGTFPECQGLQHRTSVAPGPDLLTWQMDSPKSCSIRAPQIDQTNGFQALFQKQKHCFKHNLIQQTANTKLLCLRQGQRPSSPPLGESQTSEAPLQHCRVFRRKELQITRLS